MTLWDINKAFGKSYLMFDKWQQTHLVILYCLSSLNDHVHISQNNGFILITLCKPRPLVAQIVTKSKRCKTILCNFFCVTSLMLTWFFKYFFNTFSQTPGFKWRSCYCIFIFQFHTSHFNLYIGWPEGRFKVNHECLWDLFLQQSTSTSTPTWNTLVHLTLLFIPCM